MLAARVRAGLLLVAIGLITGGLAACSAAPTKRAFGVADAGDYSEDPGDPSLPPPRPPDYNNPDSGALGAGERGRDASTPKPEGGARNPASDAGVDPLPDAGVADSGPVMCPGPLAPGDLAIVEFMIQSQAGKGDRGEWVEIQSTRNCTLNLAGLHVESPHGTQAADYVDVANDFLLGPNQTFLVVDTLLSDLNHNLPGTLLSWVATDALRNDGGTITLSVGSTIIDTLTYGNWAPHVGRTVSFPVDCTWSVRHDWGRWSWSFHVWQQASGDAGVPLQGTPNLDNDDVACY